jgi:heat shock protein HtpX
MVWFRRIALFVLTNFLVMITISVIVHLLGLDRYLDQRGINYGALMVFCLVWGFGGAFLSLLISRWVAKRAMGVQVINPENPGGSEERWLLQTVHQLAQKAGLATMPEVGIYESPDPNAFATGPDKHNALVAVSTGLFNAMDRNQIEAVLGHEITHITNGDMVTLTLLQGVINAFVMFLAYVATFMLTRGSDDRRGGGFMAQYFMRMMFQMLFGMLGMIIVMAFSRWREYRADAGGGRLSSRQNMASALRALGKYMNQPKPAEPKAIAAFKISSRDGGFLFASHPPLEKRIERLESGSFND